MSSSIVTEENERGATSRVPALQRVIMLESLADDLCDQMDSIVSLEANAGAVRFREKEVTPDDPLIIVFTSGTTGYPKGVVHSHRVLRNAANIAHVMRIEQGDRILAHMPFYHVGGAITAILPSILRGAALVTMDHWRPNLAVDMICNENITIFGGIPTHYFDLFDLLATRDQRMKSLKTAWTGGATVTAELVLAAQEKLNIDALQVAYGMTETSAATTLSRHNDALEVASSNKGAVIGDFEVGIFGEGESVLSTGEAGEIRVRGYPVMIGYYDDPSATAEAVTPQGWFKTGDIGRFDDDGNLSILGRSKDMFIVGGSNAYPAEIERMLQSHPSVRQAVVVGVPDKRLGEVGFAFIELRDKGSIAADEIKQYCPAHMADFKVPRYVEIVSEFPRTESGKLTRHVLLSRARGIVEQQLASTR
jgi:fatty-acyl-CoA synthase